VCQTCQISRIDLGVLHDKLHIGRSSACARCKMIGDSTNSVAARGSQHRVYTDWRDESLKNMLSIALGVVLISFVVTLWQVRQGTVPADYLGYEGLCFAFLGTGRFLPARHVTTRIAMLLLTLYAAGAAGGMGGLISLYGVGFLGFIVCGAIYLGKTGLAVALVVTAAHTMAMAMAFQNGWLTPLIPPEGLDPHIFKNWTRALVSLVGVGAAIGFAVVALIGRLRANLLHSVELVRELEQEKRERIGVEGQLRQTERLEALGRLAGGIAHDFNNTLTIVIGEADYIASESGNDQPVGEAAEIIRQAAEMGASLTKRLLLIGRSKDFLQPSPINLQSALAEFARIARRVLPGNIEIVMEPGESVVVDVDEAALHQALLNLAINAGDAMEQAGTLRMHCTTDAEVTGEAALATITVTDNGSGIAPEVLGEVFDPFFTTKGGVKGAGLGLASVYGFAKGSRGRVEVESELGVGTSFRLSLPISQNAAQASQVATSSISEIGKGRIALVAEDNLRVRAILWTALSDAGFEVLEAHDGETALELARNSASPISVLVTDLMMPGMDGASLAEACLGLFPEIQILVVTGFAGSTVMEKVRALPKAALLHKPFGRRELVAELQKLGS